VTSGVSLPAHDGALGENDEVLVASQTEVRRRSNRARLSTAQRTQTNGSASGYSTIAYRWRRTAATVPAIP
jgi:hypothetical protein